MRSVEKILIRPYIIVCFLLLFCAQAKAQLTVTPSLTAAVLSATLAGPGITITSPVLTCPGIANGRFTVTPGTILGTGATVFGISSGIVLTTGKASAAAGLESVLASTNNSAAGDATLTTLAGATTRDACTLEFDLSGPGDTVKFNYIFGSEEYINSTCGPYNDVCAFFISGPGIVGSQNMALVPGTTIPVTVNSVNNGIPGPGYTLANCTSMGPGSPFTTYYIDNTGGTSFTYKGFTKKLTAKHQVIPCSTYHVRMTIADASNALYDSGVFIEAASLTTPVLTGSASVCVGGTVSLSYSVPGGTWSSSNTTVAAVGSATGFVTGVSAGLATISYTMSPGCFITTNVTVTALPAITGGSSVCQGSTMALGNPTAGGTWLSASTGVATVGSSSGIVTGVGAGTATISYVLPSGCYALTTITVNALLPITGTGSLCAGSTLGLSNAVGGGSWSSGNPGIATVGVSTGIVSGVAAGIATITYTTGAGCATSTVVTINLSPAAISGSTTFCAGQNTLLSNTTAGGVWSSSDPGIAAVGSSSGIVSGISAGNATVTYRLANSCFATIAVNINTVAPITGAGKICAGSSLTLSDLVPGGIWAPVRPGVAAVGAITGVVTGLSADTITITYVTGVGCSAKTVVTVNTTPVAIKGITQICVGQTSLLTDATPGGLWSVSDLPIATVGSTSGIVKGISAGPVTVTYSIAGCLATIPFTILPLPSKITGLISICAGYTDTALNSLGGGTWHVSDPAIATIDTATGVVTGVSAGTVIITYISSGGCVATTTMTIKVSNPPLFITSTDTVFCLGTYATFTGLSAGSVIRDTGYTWVFGNDALSNVNPISNPFATPGPHTIALKTHPAGCPMDSTSRNIMIYPTPNIDLGPDTTICPGSAVLQLADHTNEKTTGARWRWSTGESTSAITITSAGSYYVRVTINGCTATDSVGVQNDCYLDIPNAFTPNGDGFNDYFFPRESLSKGLTSFHMSIYNRWGNLIFETSSTSGRGWDGKFNETPQPDGVYVYVIEAAFKDGQKETHQGNVTLLK